MSLTRPMRPDCEARISAASVQALTAALSVSRPQLRSAEDRAVLVTRLADLRRKHRNAADDDCADDEVAKIDAPVVVPVSHPIGARCDRGHEKRCGGGARHSAGHVAHCNRLLPVHVPDSARSAVCASKNLCALRAQQTPHLSDTAPYHLTA